MFKMLFVVLALGIMLVLVVSPKLAFRFNLQVGRGAVLIEGYTYRGVCLVGFGIAR